MEMIPRTANPVSGTVTTASSLTLLCKQKGLLQHLEKGKQQPLFAWKGMSDILCHDVSMKRLRCRANRSPLDYASSVNCRGGTVAF